MFGRAKRTKSTSGWESSLFGGFKRLINDYPEVKVDEDVDTIPGKDKIDLNVAERNKLLKLLLSKIQSNGLFDELLEEATSERITKETEQGPQQFDLLTTTPEAMQNVSKLLCDKEYEMAPLFEKFSDFLTNSSFQIEIPVPPEEQEGGGGGEGEGENDEDNSDDSQSSASSDQNGDPQDSDSKPQPGKEGKDDKAEPSKATAKQVEKAKEKLENTIEDSQKFTTDTDYGNYKGKSEIIIERPNATKTTFNSKEESNARSLVKMLDINWETDKDVVKNLRTGKLDPTKIAEIPGGNTSVYQRDVEEMTTRPFSVCILCDESGSMRGNRIRMQYSLVKSLYKAFEEIVGSDKMYIFGHTGYENPEVYVYHDLYNRNFLANIDNMVTTRRQGQNYDGPAIAEVHKRVREQTEDRVIFISLSDGQPSGDNYGGPKDIKDMKMIIEKCRRDDFVTVGVGIQHFSEEGLYNYSVVVEDLNKAAAKVSKLVNKVVKTEFQ